MPLRESEDFGARDYAGDGKRTVHFHLFPSANTGIPALLDMPPWVIDEHRKFNDGVMRVDLFAIREGSPEAQGKSEGARIDSPLSAPLRPEVPALEPGRSYLLEVVVRTVKMGHHFTQGTADSNEVWLDIEAKSGDTVIGKSGGLGPGGEVDPWSHFINVYMLDREGKRIDQRNAEDIFVPLYDHQIPPGAADAVHYRLDLPRELSAPVTIEAKLRYRKFDTIYMRHVYGEEFENDLPILELAHDRVTLPLAGSDTAAENETPKVEEWMRWNDYGIGLLRKGGKTKGQLRQAEEAFARVEALGRPEGPINLARVYLADGTVSDHAVAALERATSAEPPAPAWTLAWLSGLVDKQNGFLDQAITTFEGILAGSGEELARRGFDFNADYNLLNELGQTLFERARQERGEERTAQRRSLLERSAQTFERTLAIDPENVMAHFNLDLIYQQLGDSERARHHHERYLAYKPDDNARDRAIAIARAANPAADAAAEAIVIYDLRRPGAFGLDLPARAEPRGSLDHPSP
jgi:tetratricopeptide (TPR) repeat protein